MPKNSKAQKPVAGRKSLPIKGKASVGKKIADRSVPNLDAPPMRKTKFGAYSYPLRESLMVQISRIIDKRGWTQTQAADYLGVTQPRISDLARARAENFTIDLLVDWLGALGQSVSIESKESAFAPYSVLPRFNVTEDSIPYYTKAITIDPLCAPNYVKRGDAYFAQNKFDLAVGDYTRAMELEPGRPDWRLHRADAYNKLQQYKAAIFDCQNALKQIGEIQLSSFSEFAAGENLDSIVQEITWWSYLCLGRALHGSEQDDEALDAFECAIKAAPQFGRSYFERGRLFEKRKNYERAFEDYSRACQCDPGDVPSSDHLTALRRRLLQEHLEHELLPSTIDEEIDGITASLDTAKSPALKALFFRKRAEVYHNRRDYPLAIADFTRAIELDPQQNWLWSYITYGRFMTCDYVGVINDCDKVIDSDMDVVHRSGAYMYRGWALEKLNKLQEALECYNQGIRLNPQDAPLIWARGVLLEQMGESAAALADYRQTIYVSASNPSASREFVEQVKSYIDNLEGKVTEQAASLPEVDMRDTEFIVYDRLNPTAERVFHWANAAALSMGHDCLCTEFLLIGLLREGGSIAAAQLRKIGLDREAVEGAVEVILGRRAPIKRSGPFPVNVTNRLRHVLQLALDYSLHRGDKRITPEHLLLGLVLEIIECQKREEQGLASSKDDLFGIAASIILDLNIDVERFKTSVIEASWG